jgi:hypothetical protein
MDPTIIVYGSKITLLRIDQHFTQSEGAQGLFNRTFFEIDKTPIIVIAFRTLESDEMVLNCIAGGSAA